MNFLAILTNCKYSLKKSFFLLKQKINTNEEKKFVPMGLRDNITLNRKDFFFSICLQLNFSWLSTYSNGLDNTILYLTTNKERKRLFKKVLSKFKYVDRKENYDNVKLIVNQIEKIWGCNSSDSVILAVKKKNNPHPDGSVILLYALQDQLKKWKDRCFLDSFDLANKLVTNRNNIIICDDFIGSGSTIEKRIVELQKITNQKQKIYIVTLAGLNATKQNVLNKYNVRVYSPIWLNKYIDHNPQSEDCNIMLEIENDLSSKYKEYRLADYSLGYKQTGALYYNEEYRIPNNVYPLFWWGKLKDGTDFNSIFLRS